MSNYRVNLKRSAPLHLRPHDSGTDVRRFRDWLAELSSTGSLIAVDLFSGAGGLSLGLEDAGWTVAASVDHDQRALETHRHNFRGLALDLDLGDPAAQDILVGLFDGFQVDLVAGGPPCQPFSRAGRSKIRSLVNAGIRDAEDERKHLWKSFVDVALRLKPRAVLMENVPDMALGDDFRVIRTMAGMLEQSDYHTEFRMVDAWKYGVPQHRKRLILTARNDGKGFEWPEPASQITTLREAIGDLPSLHGAYGDRELPYVPSPGRFADRMRVGALSTTVHDHMTRSVRPDDLEIFELMTSKTLYSDLPERLRRYKAESFDDKYNRLDWDGLSRSITAHIAKDGYWYIHPAEHRTLTVREAARIQTFPDKFRFSGTRSDAFRQIGNAVPPMLATAAATALRPDSTSVPKPVRAVRAALDDWAEERKIDGNWFNYPGPSTTAIVALVSSIVGASAARETISPIFRMLAGRVKASPLVKHSLRRELSGSLRKSFQRVSDVMTRNVSWSDADLLADAAGLKAAERETFALLLGRDLLLTSQGATRVASRVAGSESHANNRLTDGRVDLAQLVGTGAAAPTRMAALREISSTLCTTEEAICASCPISTWCRSSSNQTR